MEPEQSYPLDRRPARFVFGLSLTLLMLSATWAGCGCKTEAEESAEAPAAEEADGAAAAEGATGSEGTTGVDPSLPSTTNNPPSDPVPGDPTPALPTPRIDGTNVLLETSAGAITVTLDTEKAPQAAANVLKHVDAGFYDGLVFHQVLADGMVQTGAYNADGVRKKPLGGSVALEIHPERLPQAGSVLLGRALSPNTGTTTLLILLVDQPALHGDYTVVGHVTEGLDVVKTISRATTERRPRLPDWPTTPITVQSAKRQ